MYIVCATDNNFVQHCAVTFISILKNNEGPISFFLLTEGLSPENEDKLNQLVSLNGGALSIILVDSEKLKNCPMPNLLNLSHISIATYYRLLIPSLLPTEIDKVIYLDCDIVVRKDLSELWDQNIEDQALGAVYQITTRTVFDAHRLNYPANYGYFNAGVLLINLKYWRENHVSEKLFDFLETNKGTIIYHDQDALNGVLFSKTLRLPLKWNMLTIFLTKSTLGINDIYEDQIINSYSLYKQEMLVFKDDPFIIHFVSKPKPWEAMCDHPYSSEYFKYLKLTPWANYKAPRETLIIFQKPKMALLILKEMIKNLLGRKYLPIKKL